MSRYKTFAITTMLCIILSGAYAYSFLDPVAIYWDAFGEALLFFGIVYICIFLFRYKQWHWLYAGVIIALTGFLLFRYWTPPEIKEPLQHFENPM